MVIGPDSATHMRQYWQQHGYEFPAIADPSGKILAQLGQEVNWFKLGRMPALLSIRSDGEMVPVHWGKSMRDLPSIAQALAVLGL